MNNVECLIISSTIDYSTDLVCLRLEEQKKSYLRINRDKFYNYRILYDLSSNSMRICLNNINYIITNETLESIYFRAPVFLRENSKNNYSLDEQLYRSQWSSFIRNLIVFDKAIWMNNPVNTYKAENKMYQLQSAIKHGLLVPNTFVANYMDNNFIDCDINYIIKSLDTALFYNPTENKEMFTYANVIKGENLNEYDLTCAPFFIQSFINPKVDIRVTFIKNKLFAYKILHNNKGLPFDWRKQKDHLEYVLFDLPLEIMEKLNCLMHDLGLNFGGIDLVINNDKYYFIEVNPTGEWGWLEDCSNIKISTEIALALCKGDQDEINC